MEGQTTRDPILIEDHITDRDENARSATATSNTISDRTSSFPIPKKSNK